MPAPSRAWERGPLPLLGLALGLLLGLLGAAPAVAVESGTAGDTSISYVERTDEGLQVLVSVPADATVDLDDVAVTIDGTTATATAAPADSTTEVRRTAVLVIDTSQSMAGERIEAAQTAALTFLDTVPDDVYVGIVTFEGEVTPALLPSLDRDEARTVVENLSLDVQTRLYDGVLAGLEMAGDQGQRQLLVLSDGADTSDTELPPVTAAVADSEVLLNVVSLGQRGPALSVLEELAEAGGGEQITAEPEALEAVFSAQADVLARQVLVTAEVPETVTSAEATVTVTLGSAAGPLVAEAFVPIGDAVDESGSVATPPADRGLLLGPLWLYVGLGALGLGLVIALVLLAPRREQVLTGAQLAEAYTARVSRTRDGDVPDVPDSAMVQATNTADKVLKASKTLESRIAERLDGAGNPFQPAEWLVLHVGVFLGMGAVGLLLGGGNLVLGILFLVLGAVGPWVYLSMKRSRRRKAFDRMLPDTMQLISGSLSAGLSLAQSIDTVVREGRDPIASEFRRVLVETRLGINLDDALEGVADRFESKDFAWVVMAIRIQRQVGGNLAELLDTVAATMREREYMRRQVSALAAEGKLSAWVLGGLPPAFMGYLLLTKRDFVMPMFTEPLGVLMLAGAGVLLAVGVFWMSRIIKVEV